MTVQRLLKPCSACSWDHECRGRSRRLAGGGTARVSSRQVAAGCPRHLLWPKRAIIPQVFSCFDEREAEPHFQSSLHAEISLGVCCRLRKVLVSGKPQNSHRNTKSEALPGVAHTSDARCWQEGVPAAQPHQQPFLIPFGAPGLVLEEPKRHTVPVLPIAAHLPFSASVLLHLWLQSRDCLGYQTGLMWEEGEGSASRWFETLPLGNSFGGSDPALGLKPLGTVGAGSGCLF